MTNNTQSTNTEQHAPISFGARLKTAREALGIDQKEAATQLRLNENIIIMMEKDKYPSDLPPTFIRGYIRAYGKLLQIPEAEILKAVEPIKAEATSYHPLPTIKPTLSVPVTSSNYFMQFFTYLIIFTMLGLVGMWWYTHPTSTSSTIVENVPTSVQENTVKEIAHPPIAANTSTQTTAVPTAVQSATATPTQQPAATNTVVEPPIAPPTSTKSAASDDTKQQASSDQSKDDTSSDDSDDNSDTSSDDNSDN